MSANRRRKFLVVSITALIFAQPAICDTLDQLYRRLKNIESVFPFAASSKTLLVGTFDATTRQFTPAVGVRRVTSTELLPNHHPIRDKFLVARVNAVNVSLRFNVVNSQGPIVATVNGQLFQATPGQNSVTVNGGKEGDFVLTLHAGNASHDDEVILDRQQILGAGAFRVPALPVLVVYEPPQDSGNQNQASITLTKTVGASTTLSFGGNQKVSSQMLSAQQLVSKIDEAVSASGVDGGEFTTVMKDFVNALPSGTTTTGDFSSTTNESTLTMTTTNAQTFTTTGHLGPGKGDMLALLRNARMAWVVTLGGEVLLSFLGADRIELESVQGIKNELQAVLCSTNPENPNPDCLARAQALRQALSVDPFTDGASVGSNSRFAGPADDSNLLTIELHGPGVSFSQDLTHDITQDDKVSRQNTTTTTEETSPGFLQVLFPILGTPQNQTIETESTQSSAKDVTVGEEVKTSLLLHADKPEDHYAIRILFDRVYGTFAFESIPISSVHILDGHIRDGNGAPLKQEMVTLEVGRTRFVTVSDSSGAYSFTIPQIPAGSATLVAAGSHKSLTINPQSPSLGIDIVRAH